MRQNKLSILMFVIIALAIFGVTFSLINDPMSFLFSILKIIGIAVVLSSLVYFIFIKKRGTSKDNTEMKKYKQALKQSKDKYKASKSQTNAKSVSQQSKTVPLRRKASKKRPSHLRVIEGNKTDKKKRATN